MTDLQKVAKLIGKLDDFVQELENLKVLTVHREINQFYYMQKAAELALLANELTALFDKQAALQQMMDTIYPAVFAQWRKDVRWLNLYSKTAGRVQDLSM